MLRAARFQIQISTLLNGRLIFGKYFDVVAGRRDAKKDAKAEKRIKKEAPARASHGYMRGKCVKESKREKERRERGREMQARSRAIKIFNFENEI